MKFAELGGWEVYLRDLDYAHRVDLMILRRENNEIQVLQADGSISKFSDQELVAVDIPPTAKLRPEMLQAFADALYARGIQPRSRRFQEEQDLLKAHLEDMRRLVFKNLPS